MRTTTSLALALALIGGQGSLSAQAASARTVQEAPSPAARTASTVAAGDTVRGTVTVIGKALDVQGTIDGDAVAFAGDVIVRSGARVKGNAMALGGKVRVIQGGVVNGDIRQIALPTSDQPRQAVAPTTWHSIKVVLGWFAVLAAIGIGVLLFAEGSLGGVTETLERQFARSFWYGLLAQLALLPTLLLMVAALTLTIVGVLLVPFAIVAYTIAFAGLVTLGFLAIGLFTGSAFRRGAVRAGSRAQRLAALLRGLVIYMAVWLVPAALTWQPLASAVMGAIALGVTWVAATLGLGASIATRVDARRAGAARKAPPMDPMVWQTPTPVTGVAAARRSRKPVGA
jgi:cytoskeletal protein CcmA (bactofilin family)